MSQREPSSAVPHELLLAQAGFLRRLASDLLRDPHAADDAVQDVWLAALERPPDHAANVRGWLSAVLKNLIAKRLRSGERRSRHEREVARSAGEAGPSVCTESEATLRFVTESVLALEEPYRSAVMLRYFEGLSVREIAERQSVPLTTMKSRLQRALEFLRTRLERERRADGRSQLSSLLALVLPRTVPRAVPVGAATGAFLMSLKTKVALLCAAALLGWLLVHEWPGPSLDPANADAEVATLPRAPSFPADPAVDAVERSSSTRELVATSESGLATANSSPSANETLVYGSLFGGTETGAARLPSAWARFADANGQSFAAVVGRDGGYNVRGLAIGRYWIRAGADGWRTLEEPFDLEAMHPRVERDLHLRAAPVLSVFVRAPDGQNLEPVVMQHYARPAPGSTITATPKLFPVATREHPGAWIPEVVGSANNHFGVGQYLQYSEVAEKRKEGSIGVIVIDGDLPVYASLVYGHAVLCTERVASGADEVDFVISAEALTENLATLKARVSDASTREPVRGALVELGLGYEAGRADADGMILRAGFKPGLYHATLSKAGYETLMLPLQLDPGRTTDLGEIALDKALELPFRVLDCEGAPCRTNFNLGVVDPVTMALEIDDNRDLNSDEHGDLVLHALGRKLYVLRTTNHDAIGDREPNLIKSVSGNVLIDLRAGSLPSNPTIRLQRASRLLLHLESPYLRGPRFRVIDEQGVELVSQCFYGSAPRPLSLPPGNYRVELVDSNGSPGMTKTVTLGKTPLLLELGR